MEVTLDVPGCRVSVLDCSNSGGRGFKNIQGLDDRRDPLVEFKGGLYQRDHRSASSGVKAPMVMFVIKFPTFFGNAIVNGDSKSCWTHRTRRGLQRDGRVGIDR